MRSSKPEEDWSVTDLDVLLSVARANLDESQRCREADAPLAAFVMLASAFEAALLGRVVAYEDQVRTAGQWPPQPSRQHLKELVELTRQMGWLSQAVTDEIIHILCKVRNVAAHPGAYVRWQAQDLGLGGPVGYEVVHDIVVRACREFFAVLPATRTPRPAGSTNRLDNAREAVAWAAWMDRFTRRGPSGRSGGW